MVFLTPSYLKALAWVLLMSPGGYLVQLGLIWPRSAHGFFSLRRSDFRPDPFAFPAARLYHRRRLAGLGRELEDAARLAGAGPWRIWTADQPAAARAGHRPAMIAIFAEGLSDFGLAATIAQQRAFRAFDLRHLRRGQRLSDEFPMAGAQALILLTLMVSWCSPTGSFAGRPRRGWSPGVRAGPSPRRRPWRWPARARRISSPSWRSGCRSRPSLPGPSGDIGRGSPRSQLHPAISGRAASPGAVAIRRCSARLPMRASRHFRLHGRAAARWPGSSRSARVCGRLVLGHFVWGRSRFPASCSASATFCSGIACRGSAAGRCRIMATLLY